jgi:branched-chain amino acid transport system ATP-binding protein
MSSILKLENVCAGYGPIEALKNVSLEVHTGEIVCIIGSNGAGKSSTLMCISRVHDVRKGRIYFEGDEVTSMEPHRLVARGLAQVPEGRRIFSRMSVLENLQLGAYLRKDAQNVKEDLEYVFSLFPILKDRSTQAGGTLSGGEQQMLAIGRALMSRPRMLLLDEPSMGIAPLLVLKIFETIKELKKKGMTILLVEQNASMALKLADRGYVMETGEIKFEDKASNLLADERVQEAYLGH